MNRDEILAALREFKRDHAEQYGITEIGIFGSFACGLICLLLTGSLIAEQC